MKNRFVLIITGPPGSGKTTLAKMVSETLDFTYISGDEIGTRLFPDSYFDIENRPEELKIVKEELIHVTKKLFDEGKNVVIDYVILGEKYIREIKDVFGNNLVIKVIFPPVETIIERDKTRECWTSGEEAVKRVYKEYAGLKPVIGENNYIDNKGQSPDETFNKYFKELGG